MEELVARLIRRHPHYGRWAFGLSEDPFSDGFHFAVVDRYRREDGGDLDALYQRVLVATEEYNLRTGCSFPVPTKDRFAETLALHLPMVLGIPWQRIRDVRPIQSSEVTTVRIKRSR